MTERCADAGDENEDSDDEQVELDKLLPDPQKKQTVSSSTAQLNSITHSPSNSPSRLRQQPQILLSFCNHQAKTFVERVGRALQSSSNGVKFARKRNQNTALIELFSISALLLFGILTAAAFIYYLINRHYPASASIPSSSTFAFEDEFHLDVAVQNVVPPESDAYYCASYDLSAIENAQKFTSDRKKGLYLSAFESINPNGAAHHILLYICEHNGIRHTTATPDATLGIPSAVSARATWRCGSGAHHQHSHNSEQHHHRAPEASNHRSTSISTLPQGPACLGKLKRTLFAWAHGAGPLELPPNTGFRVDSARRERFLVIQVHYNDKFQQLLAKNPDLTDSSGIRVRLQRLPAETTRTAGIWLFASAGFLMPQTPRVAFEMACPVPVTKGNALIPFAYRTHTHTHGLLVEAYRVRRPSSSSQQPSVPNHWTLIGSRNPQEPQIFAKVNATNAEADLALQAGDFVAARCIMSNNSSAMIHTDAGMNDEMCNFYLMYFTQGGAPLIEQSKSVCFTPGAPLITWTGMGLTVPEHLAAEGQHGSLQELPDMLGSLLKGNA